MTKQTTLSVLRSSALLALLAFAPACDRGAADTVETGEAMLSVGTIPENVACIRVTVAGEFRSVVTDFPVTPGDSLVQALSGLPVGSDVFSANAYAQECGSISKSTVAMWLSDEKAATVVQGKSTSVTLTLYKNGRAKVAVEFGDQEDGGADAGADAGSRG